MLQRREGAAVWERYWSEKESGYMRLDTEDFLKEEAREKLYHLQNGRCLLDFGCGRGELLVYYANAFSTVIGSDSSAANLEAAKQRLRRFSCHNSTLLHGDDRTLWEKLDQRFDTIAAAPVVQYFDAHRLNLFITECLKKLNDGGRIILFDLFDPTIYKLVELSILRPFDLRFRARLSSVLRGCMKTIARAGMRYLKKHERGGPMRSAPIQHPADICAVLDGQVQMESRRSMFCEYQYHLILSRRNQPALSAGMQHSCNPYTDRAEPDRRRETTAD